MAGGVGIRFWPLSRQSMPKQFLDILGTGKSFIRMTFERFAQIVPPENFLVVTNAAYRDLVLQHIPEIAPRQILCEPVGRNTAPCIAYAAFRLMAEDPDGVMIVAPSDHLILDERSFVTAVSECVDFAAATHTIMTIGIAPTRPDTGYGYIQVNDREAIGKVKTFTEKPNMQMASAFVASGEFFWNSGIFVWEVRTIMDALRRHLPGLFAQFSSHAECFGTQAEDAVIENIYPECRAVSIDYGVIEKADNVYVRPSSFGWSDMGTWHSLYQTLDKDANGNVMDGTGIAEDTLGCLVRVPEGKLAVIEGLKDYIVVDTDDVLLVCPREREDDIKKFTMRLKADEKGDRYL